MTARTRGADLEGESGSVWLGLRGGGKTRLGLHQRGERDCGGGSRVELATLPGTRKPQGPRTSTVRQLGQVKNRFQSHVYFTNKSVFHFPEVYIIKIMATG